MRSSVAVLSVIIFASTISPAIADAPSTPGYTHDDVRQLERAVRAIPTDHQFLLALHPSPSSEMPTWDPIAHYAGSKVIPDGRTAYVVLVDEKYASALSDLGNADHAVGAAVASAVFLAVMDAGRAGAKWKALYDFAASLDAVAPASDKDPYAARHALVGDLADSESALYSSISGPAAPAMDEFGLPLTEPIQYGTGLLRVARLGVGTARLIELFEYPGALPEHSADTFIDNWFVQFGAVLPSDDLRAKLNGLRGLFAARDPADLAANQKQFSDVVLGLVKHLDDSQLDAFGVGYDANEIRYNALAIKSVDEDTILRRLITESDGLDGAVSGLKALRTRLGSLGKGDWSTIADVAGQIVGKLM